jgi:multiple sugar transport system permease protein
MSTTRRLRTADIATYGAYVVICLFFAGPLLWLSSLSIRTSAEVYVSDIRLWPNDPTIQNYVSALGNPLFPI